MVWNARAHATTLFGNRKGKKMMMMMMIKSSRATRLTVRVKKKSFFLLKFFLHRKRKHYWMVSGVESKRLRRREMCWGSLVSRLHIFYAFSLVSCLCVLTLLTCCLMCVCARVFLWVCGVCFNWFALLLKNFHFFFSRFWSSKILSI